MLITPAATRIAERSSVHPRSVRRAETGSARRSDALAGLAVGALLAELETYPKPGLVSPVDCGSHDDMDANAFRRSAAALRPFFARLADAGAAGADLPALRAIGLDAEAAMLIATGGANTHRGATFALGLLCAAAGAGAADPAASVRERWGDVLRRERPTGSHGARAMAIHGVGGARGEAAAGFATAVRIGLPALRLGRSIAAASSGAGHPGSAGGPRENAARVQCVFALLAAAADTNLLHRGGADGLAFARQEAAAFLQAGGVASPGWRERAVAVHRAFVARRLSPGGTADLLAVTLFLDGWERRT